MLQLNSSESSTSDEFDVEDLDLYMYAALGDSFCNGRAKDFMTELLKIVLRKSSKVKIKYMPRILTSDSSKDPLLAVNVTNIGDAVKTVTTDLIVVCQVCAKVLLVVECNNTVENPEDQLKRQMYGQLGKHDRIFGLLADRMRFQLFCADWKECCVVHWPEAYYSRPTDFAQVLYRLALCTRCCSK